VPIDHVLLAVRDFDVAAGRLWDEHGLAAAPGGEHAGWGTGNRIVPLGRSYIELIGVLDQAQAARSEPGSLLIRQLEEGDHLIGWCVAPPDFDGAVSRLGLEVSRGSRHRPDGTTIRWRSAGFVDALHDPSRPFLIDWEVPLDLHPGRTEVAHRVQPRGVGWIEVSGNPDEVQAYLGDEHLPVRARPGPPGVLAVGIETDRGEVVLR
jgi:Glyoxalase-like domain